LRGPYLLVGHSVGELHAQVFGAQYPADTAGLVLVSATHPDQFANWLALLPAPVPGEEKALTDARAFLTSAQTDPAKNEERLDMRASALEAHQLTSLGSKPVIVATHSPRFRMMSEYRRRGIFGGHRWLPLEAFKPNVILRHGDLKPASTGLPVPNTDCAESRRLVP